MHTEELLHFAWKKGLLSGRPLTSVEGSSLEVLLPGEENKHAGPDFFNARLRVGRLTWAGNVEVHHAASDWNRHGHHLDPSYDNVILHVIQHCDANIKNSKGRQILTLLVDPGDPLLVQAEELRKVEKWIPCGNKAGNVPDLVLKSWFRQLYKERLEFKISHICNLQKRFGGDRSRSLWVALAAGFGLPVNTLPFEMLACSIPFPLLMEIKNNLSDLEALLFGCSGLLFQPETENAYIHSLRQRYTLINKEFNIKQIPAHLWKFLRNRPASFPTLRIAQFASLLHAHFPLKEEILRKGSLLEIEGLLKVKASPYWDTHYTFGKSSPSVEKRLGQLGIRQLLINVIVPYAGFLHHVHGSHGIPSPAMAMSGNIEAETNYIVRNWIKFGVNPGSAADSQAMIHLYTNYCLKKRCAACPFQRE